MPNKTSGKKNDSGGGKSLRSAGDYYAGADLGKSKGRSAASRRRINKTVNDVKKMQGEGSAAAKKSAAKYAAKKKVRPGRGAR